MGKKQLELSGVPRKRNVLIGDVTVDPVKGEPPPVSVESVIGYSPWVKMSQQPPPCVGYWDIKDESHELNETRAYYHGEFGGFWDLFDWPFPMRAHGDLQWRGLKSPWPTGRRRAVIEPVQCGNPPGIT